MRLAPPSLINIPSLRDRPAVGPGLFVMSPREYISINLVATSAGHTSTGRGIGFGMQLGLATRHHYFNSLNEAMSANVVPEKLKTLLSVWVRPSQEKKEPDKSPDRTKSKRRRKR
jgi:hypothetical protein